jgi:hypothetical protein
MSKKSSALRRPHPVRADWLHGAPELPAANACRSLAVAAELLAALSPSLAAFGRRLTRSVRVKIVYVDTRGQFRLRGIRFLASSNEMTITQSLPARHCAGHRFTPSDSLQ